jgi:hypothetical protein
VGFPLCIHEPSLQRRVSSPLAYFLQSCQDLLIQIYGTCKKVLLFKYLVSRFFNSETESLSQNAQQRQNILQQAISTSGATSCLNIRYSLAHITRTFQLTYMTTVDETLPDLNTFAAIYTHCDMKTRRTYFRSHRHP